MYIISSPYTLGKNLYISYKICKVFTDWKNYVTKYDENVYICILSRFQGYIKGSAMNQARSICNGRIIYTAYSKLSI
jgi:hypothetical protein